MHMHQDIIIICKNHVQKWEVVLLFLNAVKINSTLIQINQQMDLNSSGI
jgi:hypothetical protein